MDVTEVSIIHHIAVVLLVLWILASIGWSNTLLYFVSLLYLFAVNQHYTERLRRKLQYEERKYANQRKLLSDSETVRWLNHAVEKIWPICMEQVASQHFLLPIIPWFLDKYKPWTASKAVVEHLYLGRNPPMFTEMRVLGESSDDDHLVLQLGMSFLSGNDMSAILAVQLRKSLGLGIWTNMHITGMHIEGKVLVGVKFLRQWPFIGRVRVCFSEAPYFQMTVKPIFNHGIDVTELPGIAGWLDKLLAFAFEQTLVEPNMLVIDVEKFVSTPSESWFSVYEKPPVACVKLEIIEGANMKPSDLNGLADPYVKGHLGTFRFRSKTQKKTLSPKWFEEFKIPISTWETPNTLFLEVRDKDHIFDDMLGECLVNISELRGGKRHDKWITLKNIKTGRLHIAITVYEDEQELSKMSEVSTPKPTANIQHKKPESLEQENNQMSDVFEPINIEGQEKTGVWVHRPGEDVFQTWETRKGHSRHPETELQRESNQVNDSPRSEASTTQCSEENGNGKKLHPRGPVGRGLKKIGSLFQRSPRKGNSRKENEENVDSVPTPRPNIRAVDQQAAAVRIILDDSFITDPGDLQDESGSRTPGKNEVNSPDKKDTSKNSIKQAGLPSPSIKGVLKRKGSSKSKQDQAMDSVDSLKSVKIAVDRTGMDAVPSDNKIME